MGFFLRGSMAVSFATREREKVQVWGKEPTDYLGANALHIREWVLSRHVHQVLETELQCSWARTPWDWGLPSSQPSRGRGCGGKST